MLLPHNAIVAVADGEKLSLFRNGGSESELKLEAVDSPKLHATGPGSGGRHHSSSANPDNSRLAEDAYAAAVAGWLNQEVGGEHIQSLFVIAAPKTLGELRLHYSRALKLKLAGELSKDLSGHAATEITAAVMKAR